MGIFTPLTNKQFGESEIESTRHSLSIIWCVKLSPNWNSKIGKERVRQKKIYPLKIDETSTFSKWNLCFFLSCSIAPTFRFSFERFQISRGGGDGVIGEQHRPN